MDVCMDGCMCSSSILRKGRRGGFTLVSISVPVVGAAVPFVLTSYHGE
jgi:hypothetical protein